MIFKIFLQLIIRFNKSIMLNLKKNKINKSYKQRNKIYQRIQYKQKQFKLKKNKILIKNKSFKNSKQMQKQTQKQQIQYQYQQQQNQIKIQQGQNFQQIPQQLYQNQIPQLPQQIYQENYEQQEQFNEDLQEQLYPQFQQEIQQNQEEQQIQAPKLNRKRKQIKQNLNSKLVQQKYQFTNLNEDQQQIYQQQQQQFIPQDQIESQKVLDFNDIINTKQCEEMTQLDENMNYENVFLGKEEAFKDFKIIVGQFYIEEGFKEGFLQTAGKELNRIGFKYDIVYTQDEFSDKCMDYDIAYVLSGIQNQENKKSDDKFVSTIEKFMKASKSLFIWADNDPYYYQANLILKKIFNGMHLKGDYYGNQIINVGDKNQKQKFDADHAIAYGLNNLYEGITICHPEQVHKDFEVFAFNSENKPLVITAEENENHGRIIVDMGFTKLLPQFWITTGTHQYVSNCTVWLTGIIE